MLNSDYRSLAKSAECGMNWAHGFMTPALITLPHKRHSIPCSCVCVASSQSCATTAKGVPTKHIWRAYEFPVARGCVGSRQAADVGGRGKGPTGRRAGVSGQVVVDLLGTEQPHSSP